MPEQEDFKRHMTIITYNLSKLNSVKKVRFVYLLKGRTENTGLVNEFKGHFLVPGCFMIPSERSAEIELVFKLWKVPYKKEEVLMR